MYSSEEPICEEIKAEVDASIERSMLEYLNSLS